MRHTGGLLSRAVSMVVQLETYGLEARLSGPIRRHYFRVARNPGTIPGRRRWTGYACLKALLMATRGRVQVTNC
jgi:hypothetical protein